MGVHGQQQQGRVRMRWKTAFDISAAVIGLLVLSPLLLLIILLILCADGRPVLFHQPRLGQGKQLFSVCKFRTMHAGRVTVSGKLLRQTGLDELAQILNILRGEMSVVGPRPLTQEDVQRLGWDDTYHASRWQLKPGITGLAQLYGGRGARVSWHMDQLYLQRVSLWLDVRIVLLSFLVNLLGKRRVRGWLWGR